MNKKLITIFAFFIFGLTLTVKIHGQNPSVPKASETPVKQSANEKPLKIKRNPTPRVEPGMCRDRVGYAAVNVTFDKSAKVTNAEIASSTGCQRFDKFAVSAAKSIKFEPAMKDGEPITTIKKIEYTYVLP